VLLHLKVDGAKRLFNQLYQRDDAGTSDGRGGGDEKKESTEGRRFGSCRSLYESFYLDGGVPIGSWGFWGKDAIVETDPRS